MPGCISLAYQGRKNCVYFPFGVAGYKILQLLTLMQIAQLPLAAKYVVGEQTHTRVSDS
jgi:hypothetical protein